MALKQLDGKEDWGSKFTNLYNRLTDTVNNLSAGTPAGTYTAGDGIDISGASVITVSGINQYINILPNANFNVAEAGTSFAAIASGEYFCDVWGYSKSGAMVHTASQSADAPTISQAGEKFAYSGKISCTTADASIAAGDYTHITGFIEGADYSKIAGGDFYVSFWHKHTVAGTYCVAFRNSGSDRSFITEYTQSIGDAWEYATVLVSAAPETGTWNYTAGTGLTVAFAAACGTTLQNTADTWHTGNYIATSSQANNCATVSNDSRITGVKFGSTDVITSVQNQQQALAQVQRYYFQQKHATWFRGDVSNSLAYRSGLSFPVTMRADPSAPAVLTSTTSNFATPTVETSNATGAVYNAIASSTAAASWYHVDTAEFSARLS